MRSLLALSAALAFSASAATAAPIVHFYPGLGTLPAGTHVIQSFDGFAPGALIGTKAYALNTNSSLGTFPVYGSNGNFGSVLTDGSYDIAFGPTSLFAFVFGSLNSFNAVKLFLSDGTSITYHGNDMAGGSRTDGDPTSIYANGVVTYSAGSGPRIVGAQFTSSGNAFEIDNLSIAGAAPEPAAWALMILGFGATGSALRRRSKFAARLA